MNQNDNGSAAEKAAERNKDPAFAFVLKFCPKLLESKKTDDKYQIAKKITHLCLNNKNIYCIGEINLFSNLIILYLHENKIKKIENLDLCFNLTHLYLQRNEITKIEGLRSLKKLVKLYLGYNHINVVEGLENLVSLTELHTERQILEKSDSMCFDPRSIIAIRPTLKILNISDNNMHTLSEVRNLHNLELLLAKNNQITDLETAANDIQELRYLKEINLFGNPITKQLKYRDQLIIKTYSLKTIDGKDVQENTRTFLKNFDQEKKHNHFRQDSKISHFQSLSAPIINRFPPELKPDVKKSTKFTNGPKLDGAICLSQIEPPSKLHDSSIKPYPSFATIDVSCVEEELFLPWNKLPPCNKAKIPPSLNRKPQVISHPRNIHTLHV